ncbi:MAG: hypothetical protein GF381_01915 [Candidatus Pacebacteria bacterium]|nr:hypothetical protein [Candidatus Paceibacterota bacterium]
MTQTNNYSDQKARPASPKNNQNSNLKTEWDLSLLYSGPSDPQIQMDLKQYDRKRRQFAQKYKNRTDFLQNEDKLLEVLKEYEALIDELNGARPLVYFHYLSSINSNDEEAQGKLNLTTHQITHAHNHLSFFPIKLGKIKPEKRKQFLKSDKLSQFHYLLKRRFELAPYDLSEDQEKILNLTAQTSYNMWTKGVEKGVNDRSVALPKSYQSNQAQPQQPTGQKSELPLSEAVLKIPELETKDRRQLHQAVLQKAAELTDFAEAEINAVVTHKKIEDQLRGFETPFQSTLLAEENDPEIIDRLARTTVDNYPLAHRFYQLKAQLLELDQLTYADRGAKMKGFDREYSFKQTIQIVRNTFAQLDEEFLQILDKMLENGQIDVFPRKGKSSGAYCSSSINNPTFVLLNHTNDFNSVTTFAHELGHAIHSELSKKQPVLYQDYSSSTAETASTFFEQLVFEALIADFSPQEKLAALHNRVQDDVNTVFRQIALFEFEKELHQQIRDQGYLGASKIGQLLNLHMANYLGPKFNLTALDGKFFILWNHIRYYFYTYTYAYGQLISQILVKRVSQDRTYIKQIKQFLSAGGSQMPRDIFAEIGLEINQDNFFEQGMEQIKTNLDRLEKLAK